MINSAFTVHKFCFICQLCSFLFLVFGGNQEDWGGSEYLGEVLPPPTETSRRAVTDVAGRQVLQQHLQGQGGLRGGKFILS